MVPMPYRYWKLTVVRIHMSVPTLMNIAPAPAIPPPAACQAAFFSVTISGCCSAGAGTSIVRWSECRCCKGTAIWTARATQQSAASRRESSASCALTLRLWRGHAGNEERKGCALDAASSHGCAPVLMKRALLRTSKELYEFATPPPAATRMRHV